MKLDPEHIPMFPPPRNGKLFRVQTTRGSFQMSAASIGDIVRAFETHNIADELIGIIEEPWE